MGLDAAVLNDPGLRGFWVRHGLALFTFLWVGTVVAGSSGLWVVYTGLQQMVSQVQVIASRQEQNTRNLEDSEQGIASNQAGVNTLMLDRATTTAALERLVEADKSLLQSLRELEVMFEEYVESAVAADKVAEISSRIAWLEILIRLDEYELRRIQRITGENAARPATELEIEAEAEVLDSLRERRRQLQILRDIQSN